VPSATPGGGADEGAWDVVKDTIDSQVLRRFIRQFPDSPHRAEAESRLQRMVSLPPRAPEPGPSPHRRDRGRSNHSGGAARTSGARQSHAAVRPARNCFMFNGRQVCE
jgi:hypothetical protein